MSPGAGGSATRASADVPRHVPSRSSLSTSPRATCAGGCRPCSGFFIGVLRSSPSVTPSRRSSLSQGPCFSPRSTSWPPHDGVRRAGGTISRTSLPEAGRSSRYNELARPAVPAGRPSARSADLLQLTRSMILSGARSLILPAELRQEIERRHAGLARHAPHLVLAEHARQHTLHG